MKIEEIDYGICGIYKIVFNNDKLYIGLSNDIRRRMIEHVGRDLKQHPDLLVSKAILKYGIKDIEIIETFDVVDRELLKEREIYWIEFYNTFKDRNRGYNMTSGGDGASSGIYNVASKLSEDDLEKIYNYLQNTNLSYEKIADLTHSSYSIVSRINSGCHYHNNNFNYPLRKIRAEKYGLENKHSAFYNREQDLLNLIRDLKDNILDYKELREKYQIKQSTLTNINQGKIYFRSEEKYPLRPVDKGRATRRIFTENELLLIKEKLENPNITMAEIAKEVHCDRKVITDINSGKRQPNNNWNYPIRNTKSKTGLKK